MKFSPLGRWGNRKMENWKDEKMGRWKEGTCSARCEILKDRKIEE
ncbi:MAG: hypothetical protein WCX31_00560 [Salinivirgaceae bacterium]|jgi:hypothetical protein